MAGRVEVTNVVAVSSSIVSILVPIPGIGSGVAYAAGDAVGTAFRIPNAAREAGKGGTIETVVLIDRDNERIETDLVLFTQPISGTADNAAFDPDDRELAHCIGHVKITAGEYVAFNDNAEGTVRTVGLTFQTDQEPHLYGQLVTRGAPNLAASTDYLLRLAIWQR